MNIQTLLSLVPSILLTAVFIYRLVTVGMKEIVIPGVRELFNSK